jgi:acetoin:2,6-dichlorophenolindophenol oxidoreductase subunit alpha
VFVCENNLYMEYTPIGDVTAVAQPAADRAGAYGLEPVVVDGNDPDEVYAAATATIARARAGEGPSLVEAKTYRHGGHSRADPGKYRPDDEVQKWLAKDPLPMYRDRLLEVGATAAELDRIEADADAAIERATQEARDGAEPGADLVMTDLWADGGSAWRN